MRTPFVAAALFLAGVLFGGPASAYCIVNQANIPVIVRLETPNPLGGFHRIVWAGQQACCDWFDRRCNPTGTRDDLLQFRIRDRKRGQTPSQYFCLNAVAQKIYGVANGTITVTREDQKDGQLTCTSKDFFNRDVKFETHRPKKRVIRPIVPPPIVVPDGPPEPPENEPDSNAPTDVQTPAGEARPAARPGVRVPETAPPTPARPAP